MDWHIYISFFWLSTIKFLFTPFAGPASGLTFIETYVSCVAGGVFSATIFFFASEYFMIRTHKKRKEMIRKFKEEGVPMKEKKKFTRMNKFIVRIKRRFGIIGISMYAPLFLSVPIGTIIAAKFYGKDKRTFPLILLGMGVNGGITAGIAYGIGSLF